MKKYILPFAGFLMLTLALVGCRKDALRDMTEEESRIYITNRDSSASFGSFRTFSISDSVAVISNNRLEDRQSTSFDRVIVNAVKNEMLDRGYTQVARDASPDLGINVSRLYNSSTGIVSYPDYWGGYNGYYDPFYWGYPGYGYNFPGAYGVYEITEGALSVDILDLKNANQSEKSIKGIWNGLIRGTGVFGSANGETNVRALFAQSPYLKAN
jgi:uncharacterized protein DUF4136